LVKKFANLNQAGVDTFDHLQGIGTSSISILKLGVPMGSLIAAGLDIVFDPASDEQIAIKLLHKEMNENFEKVNYQIEKAEKSMRSDLVEVQYNSEVTVSLLVLVVDFRRVTDPDLPRKPFKTAFIAQCTGAHSPSRILLFIYTVYKTNCPIPTSEDISTFVRVYETFTKIEAGITDLYDSSQNFLPVEYEKKKRCNMLK
jgi:hypothetical protein